MQKIILHLQDVSDRDDLYDRIAAAFDFPAYFGRNLDALFDCLTQIATDTCVGLYLPPYLDLLYGEDDDFDDFDPAFDDVGEDEEDDFDPEFLDYLSKVRITFEDAELANGHLCVIVA